MLDSDVMSLLERGNADSLVLQMRLENVASEDIFTTIVNYEEHMRGWMAIAAQSTTATRLVAAYERLQVLVATFRYIPLLPFNEKAAEIFNVMRKARIRIGTMDLRIAAIALAHDATVLTRNVRHFSQVPGLRVEDWSLTI